MKLNWYRCEHSILPSSAVEYISRFDILLALVVSSILTWFTFLLFPLQETNPVEIYYNMAKAPFHFFHFPYGARILTPLLVYCLPGNIDTGFRIVAFIAYCGSGVLLWILLRLFSVNRYAIAALLPAFFLAPTSRFIVANAWYVDPLSFSFLTVTFFSFLIVNRGMTMAALMLGAMNRPESLMILPVICIAWFNKRESIRSVLSCLFCAFPAIMYSVLIFFVWPKLSDQYFYKMISGTDNVILRESIREIFDQQGFAILWSPVIYREMLPFLWGFALIGFFYISTRLKILSIVYVALCALQMVVANDYYRLPFYAFPIMFILSGVGLNSFLQELRGYAVIGIILMWFHLALFPRALWPALVICTVFFTIPKLFKSKTPSHTS